MLCCMLAYQANMVIGICYFIYRGYAVIVTFKNCFMKKPCFFTNTGRDVFETIRDAT